MLLPSAYLAYSLYREQQFKKNSDMFIENEFTNKGYTVIYKKTTFTPRNKKIELAFLSKRFEKAELNELDSVIGKNTYLKGTELVIRQDSTDRFTALKGDILKQVKSNENELNEKDVRIMQLEKELEKNKFDSKALLNEANALFPQITSISATKQEMVTRKDSIIPITTVLYKATEKLKKEDSERLGRWLEQRLHSKNVMIFSVPENSIGNKTKQQK